MYSNNIFFIFHCIPVKSTLPNHYFNTNAIESFELKLIKTDFSQFLNGTQKMSYPCVLLIGTFMYMNIFIFCSNKRFIYIFYDCFIMLEYSMSIDCSTLSIIFHMRTLFN